ncbi:isotrichodermin c-15 hydroxylase [Ophiostoma piceae UAMH 11346]|uniref:Isotrichodermin c-15 hydroxylase n=1 Tax=Ophiostoma piceae (strain UAMH 11346) TaxID=1262450 RepID=S3BWT8_OPHP1|nr:isotrichodermin c-15 hydroxylase [Ophiostoma piceae UAMH 11346]
MHFHSAHLLAWVGALLVACVFYTLSIIVYRLFFHPLAKYPGPVLAKITGCYALYHAWKGDRHLEFYRLHQMYGSVVRCGPNALSFDTATALKDIYGFRSNVGKAEFYDAFAHPAHNTHNTRDKKEHARKRRVLSHAFSDAAVKEAERYILQNVRTFCDVLAPSSAEASWTTHNMSDLCNWLAMDILGDLCFGKAFHMLERTDNRFAIDLVSAAAKRHVICGTMPVIDRLGLDKYLFHKIAAGRARYIKYCGTQLAERMKLSEKDADRRDFFYYLLQARDPETGQGFSKPELWGEANLLIIAGSDTTSTAMAATLFYLVRHAAALERASAEVRGVFADVEEIKQGAALASCTYLRACIDEAMRLSPSVGGLLPREVLLGGHVVDGHAIPAGVEVGTPHYAIHHNELYYPQAYSFVPERWIVGEQVPFVKTTVTDGDLSRAQSAFCPFSVGPRGCIGKGLAYTEMMTTLARVLFLYDMRKAQGVADPGEGGTSSGLFTARDYGRQRINEFQLTDTFTSTKDGPLVEVRARTSRA